MAKPPVFMTHKERFDRYERLRKDVVEGMSVTEAASKYGLINQTVEGYVSDILKARSEPGASAFAILAMLLNTDESVTDIAKKCGVSKQQVSKINRAATAAGIRVMERKKGPKPRNKK